MLADDFAKLYILIDKIAKNAKVKDTIQHVNLLEAMDFWRKEVRRALFVKENEE